MDKVHNSKKKIVKNIFTIIFIKITDSGNRKKVFRFEPQYLGWGGVGGVKLDRYHTSRILVFLPTIGKNRNCILTI